jgi:superfamily I DNA/RNA helicase
MATMHRVKGLEFDRLIIAGVNNGIVPFETEWRQSSDKVIQRENENQEKALHIAATKARKEAVVISFGKASRFFQ